MSSPLLRSLSTLLNEFESSSFTDSTLIQGEGQSVIIVVVSTPAGGPSTRPSAEGETNLLKREELNRRS